MRQPKASGKNAALPVHPRHPLQTAKLDNSGPFPSCPFLPTFFDDSLSQVYHFWKEE
jgi:hypothetical protein